MSVTAAAAVAGANSADRLQSPPFFFFTAANRRPFPFQNQNIIKRTDFAEQSSALLDYQIQKHWGSVALQNDHVTLPVTSACYTQQQNG
jgi:hypothetical protein